MIKTINNIIDFLDYKINRIEMYQDMTGLSKDVYVDDLKTLLDDAKLLDSQYDDVHNDCYTSDQLDEKDRELDEIAKERDNYIDKFGSLSFNAQDLVSMLEESSLELNEQMKDAMKAIKKDLKD